MVKILHNTSGKTLNQLKVTSISCKEEMESFTSICEGFLKSDCMRELIFKDCTSI